MTLLRACLAVIPFALFACDLPPKDIGDESESNSGTGSGTSDGGTPCVHGDQMPAPDGCNTCECVDGDWACTLVGCGDDGPHVCEDGAMMPAPDGCNTCTCIDGDWACTLVDCADDDGNPICEDGDVMPAPDGCNTCECAAGQWGCTKLDCIDAILVCDPGTPQDAVVINSVMIVTDSMLVDVSYGGGCEEHDFGLCWDRSFAESDPVQVSAFVSHDGHDDPCDAFPSEQLQYDLQPLRQAWQDAYNAEHGSIDINLAGWGEEIVYTF